jgi:thiol-disulfide isomerase/thioredoxin
MKFNNFIKAAVAITLAALLFVANYNFDEKQKELPKTVKSSKVQIVSFSSPGCGACVKQKKILNLLREEYSDKVDFEFVDVTKDSRTTDYYDVGIVPTLLVTVNGKEIDRLVGSQMEPVLRAVVESEAELGKYCEDGSLC